MSGSNGDDAPDAVTPEMVVAEQNLLENIRNALGVSEDFDADDTMQAAIAFNTARAIDFQKQILAAVTGDADFSPTIDIDAQAFREALSSEHHLTIYGVDTTSASDNILTRPIRPTVENSSFRITVALSGNETFQIQVNPDNDPSFTSDLNKGNALFGMREFTFDADMEAEYNFQTGAATTVDMLRVVEVFTE